MTEPTRIGIIIGRIYQTVNQKQLSGMLEEAFARKIDAYIFTMHEEDAEHLLDRIAYSLLDGVIFVPYSFDSRELAERIEQFLTEHYVRPVVRIGREQGAFSAIWYDDREEMAEITRHMIQVHQCRKLIYLTDQEESPVSLERLAGFREALEEADLPYEQENIIYGDFYLFAAQKLAQEFAEGNRAIPDAVICMNDRIAVSLCDALNAYQIDIPGDMLVTGYEGTLESALHSPSITTYASAWEQLGRNAMCQLNELMTGEKSNSSKITSGSLICRESCGCHPTTVNQSIDLRYLHLEESYLDSRLSSKLLSCTSLESLIMTIYRLNYLFFQPEHDQYERYCLCLCENWNQDDQPTERMYRMHDNGGYTIFPVSDILPPDFREAGQPTATFFVSVCFQERYFGYTLLQYTSHADSINPYYFRYCRELGNALEYLRVRSALENLVYQDALSQVRDPLTGLYKLNQLPDIWKDYLEDVQSRNEKYFWIAINIAGLYRLAETEGIPYRDKLLVAFSECLQNTCGYHERYLRADDSAFLILGSEPESSRYHHLLIQSIREHFERYQRTRKQIVLPLQAALLSDEEIIHLTEETVPIAAAALITQAKSSKALYADQLHHKELKALRQQIYQTPEQEWSVRKCSQSLKISSSYFCKIYQKAFGVTCAYDIRRSKMEYGKYLLMHTADTLQEISRKCGYDYSHFMRTFKKFYQMTPTEYRRGK